MTPLYTEEQFNLAKSRDKLPHRCVSCGKTFYKIKYDIQKSLKQGSIHKTKYCSIDCMKNKKKLVCENCNKEFTRIPSQIKRSNKHFCSQSCSAIYSNSHKSFGATRSKLEKWIELQLTSLYPKLEISYNKTNEIGAELDIYIPSLKLAFELNGIFHFLPIFGEEKLTQVQKSDKNKIKLCQEHKISLCIIDTSSQKYFKENSSKKYLDIITNIISKND